MNSADARFPTLSRFLHWTMAAAILLMLFIGVGMVSSPTAYHGLVSVHRPLGALILALVAIRLINRLLNPPPPLPSAMPGALKAVAHASHLLLYLLMFATPIAGWAMLSAGGYPIVLVGALHLPPILPVNAPLFAVLRPSHTVLALSLFAVFLAHMAAALTHALVFKDGVFEAMASLKLGRGRPQP